MDEMNNNRSREAVAERGGVLFVVLGWISAVLSLFIYPFIFGVVGVVLGILATKNRSKAGLPVIVASIILMGIGLIFNDTLRMYAQLYLGI